MSKFLKILVNTFLICAILVAAAILIPPIAGISTTIVDSAAMNTNLPLGSITYSTNVDTADLKSGDEVLKDNDISTYAYIIKSGDETTGKYRVVSAADPEGTEEEIYLRNSVPKVAVVVPYIGYIMIAMHSIEGIIIIALVVILMIILFILSELWKPDDEDEEGEEEMTQDDVVHAGLTEANDSVPVDTETIRAAMEANVAAVNADEVPEEIPEQSAETSGEEKLTWSERRALKKARKKEEKERRAAEEAKAAEESSSGNQGMAEYGAEFSMPEDEPDKAEEQAVWENVPAAGLSLEDISQREHETGGASIFDFDIPAVSKRDDAGSRAADLEFLNKLAEAADEACEEDPVIPAAQEPADIKEAVKTADDAVKEQEIPDEVLSGATKIFPDIRIVEPEVFLGAEDMAPSGKAAAAPEPVKPAETASRRDPAAFTPAKRPTLTEMLDQAKASGETPQIVQDDETGVTVLDYSDLL